MPRVTIATLSCAIFLVLPWLGPDVPEPVEPIYWLVLIATPILAIFAIREGIASDALLRRLAGLLVGVGTLAMIFFFVVAVVGAVSNTS